MQIETIAPDQSALLECGHPESQHSSITRGYGKDAQGNRHCYACCADRDREQMRNEGKTCLYLTQDKTGQNQIYMLSNWPGSLKIPVRHIRKGRHNMARVRYDVRFVFEGSEWSGTQYGDNTQICHCRRLKK